MTLRERIADWISGGAFFVYKNQASVHHERMHYYARKMNTWRSKWHENERQRRQLAGRLSDIAAQETPGANATVRRMARIARGEE